jgi:single-strand DNA-binding protein
MARGINKVIAIGNLGKDPETRFVPSGAPVCSFSIAVGESWTDKSTGEKKERTEWINCEVWGKLAEICQQYLTKGSQCYIEGKLQTDEWDDKDSGQKRYRTKVRLDNVQFLSSKDSANKPRDEKPGAPPPGGAQGEFDDDIPF